MPKTTVYEDSNARLPEDEIWTSEYSRISPPTRYRVFSKKRHKRKLCVFVPASSNARHDLRASIFVEYVGHVNLSV
jgi:hypothetical protein